MSKLITTAVAAIFAASVAGQALAADQKKEQAHKGTPEAGSVQKQEKAQKKDGTGKAAEPTKAAEPAKAPK